MDQQLIDLILGNLDHYDYPGFRIKICRDAGELDFGGDLYGQFVPADAPTDRELDAYHHTLLHHTSEHENLAGLASVIYWGYATFGNNGTYGRNKVTWFMQARGNGPASAARCLQEARNAVAQAQYGEALGAVGQMSQLGQTPFASKVIAFLCPDHAGVYDNRIANGLVDHPVLRNQTRPGGLFEHCTGGVGRVASPTIRRKYQAWCVALGQIAEHVNGGGRQPRIRALDVERAIFSAIA